MIRTLQGSRSYCAPANSEVQTPEGSTADPAPVSGALHSALSFVEEHPTSAGHTTARTHLPRAACVQTRPPLGRDT